MIIITLHTPYPPKRDYNFEIGTDIVNFDNFHVGTIIEKNQKLDMPYNKIVTVLHIDYIQPLGKKVINLDGLLNVWKNGMNIEIKDDDKEKKSDELF
jgi:hypothetical protein